MEITKKILTLLLLFGVSVALLQFFVSESGNGISGAAKHPETKVDYKALLQDEKNTIEIFRKSTPLVAFVYNLKYVQDFLSWDVSEVQRGTGTGFVWDNQGHVVTNFHVIAGAQRLAITLEDGKKIDASVVGVEPRKDIAVLRVKLPKQFQWTFNRRLADSTSLIVGQKALAIGNPFGLDHTLTVGSVSALGRSVPSIGGVTIRDMVQTDAPINPGNSGGPLIDSRGYLIGMNTAIFSKSGSSAGIGFAVPANTINRVVTQIIRYGKVRQPSIGIERIDDSIANQLNIQGVIVSRVIRGTPAEKARLRGTRRDRSGRIRLGDVIVGINRVKVSNYDDLYNALERKKIGDTVTLHFERDGKKQTVDIQLARLPEEL